MRVDGCAVAFWGVGADRTLLQALWGAGVWLGRRGRWRWQKGGTTLVAATDASWSGARFYFGCRRQVVLAVNRVGLIGRAAGQLTRFGPNCARAARFVRAEKEVEQFKH